MEQEVSALKKLQVQLDAAETVFKTWDLDSMNLRKDQVTARLDSVSNFYTNRNLIMEMPVGLLMADFKNAGKAYKRIAGDYHRVKEELDFSKGQLIRMKEDMESGSMKQEQASQYLSEESLAVKSVYDQVFKMDTIFMRSEKIYAEFTPQVDSLIATFKNSH